MFSALQLRNQAKASPTRVGIRSIHPLFSPRQPSLRLLLGYWGIGVRNQLAGFNFSAYVFRHDSAVTSLSPRLVATANNQTLTSASVSIANCPVSAWCFVTVSLPAASSLNNPVRFELVVDQGTGTVLLDHVSLFPEDAVSGLWRPDLLELMKGLAPGFMRMPGGNYLEGDTFATRWDWKKTLYSRQNRTGHYNTAWGYWVRDGDADNFCASMLTMPSAGDGRRWIVRAPVLGPDPADVPPALHLHR